MDLKAVDIVGCANGEGTRSCTSHEVCGNSLSVDDVVVFRCEVVWGHGDQLQEAIKVYKIVGVEQLCHIGFLPRRLLTCKTKFANKLAVVVEDYRVALSVSKRNRSDRCHGIVKAVLMEHVEEYNRS
ncbi:hypothetical protein H257_14288 [Aphanomyces astaci]|uniref:Uncharacterized protein n=1 Tax=Aphanomyces astaci TaxID=112090 RepID=W4FU06_APHAT|nr:hypothetical protein H257_14288 [Aphanomyces astaci]ETV70128.1 hypothetical protein H257_14288 [Aphanomyces astaci]|eukprot:XP_009840359.1 hypothetical protein H257_14288 [Aphanomyces astaci]